MGCDIHVCIEVKNNDGEWKNYDNFRYNPYYIEDDEFEEEIVQIPIFKDRDYLLFTRLCGVREHSLVKVLQLSTSDEEFTLQTTDKVSECKGIPSDCSDITKKIIYRWDSDGHSHSFLTLKEIQDYIDKKPPKKHEGFLSKIQISLLEQGQTPDSWSNIKLEECPYFKQWERPWDEKLDSGIIDLAEAMKKRAKEFFWNKINPEKVRIVFFFDN